MSAIRVARGRHGSPEAGEVRRQLPRPLRRAAGRGRARPWPSLGLPGSAGVTAGAVADTVVAPYNVVPDASTTQVACVIVEPIAANMGLVAPGAGLPRGPAGRVRPGRRAPDLRRGHHRASGSARAARQELFGVTPDLTTFGKVIGGRPAGRRLRGPGRRHGRCWPRSVPCTRPAPCRGTRSPPRPGAPRSSSSPPPPTTTLDRLGWPVRRRPRPRRSSARGAAPCRCRWSGRWLGLYFGDELPVDYETAKRTDETGVRRLLPRDARPGRGPRARRLRGHVPGHDPPRRDPRPSRRPGRRGRVGRRLATASPRSDPPPIAWRSVDTGQAGRVRG